MQCIFGMCLSCVVWFVLRKIYTSPLICRMRTSAFCRVFGSFAGFCEKIHLSSDTLVFVCNYVNCDRHSGIYDIEASCSYTLYFDFDFLVTYFINDNLGSWTSIRGICILSPFSVFLYILAVSVKLYPLKVL